MDFYNLYSDHIIFQQLKPFKVYGHFDNQDLKALLLKENKIVSIGKIKYLKNNVFQATFDSVKGTFDTYTIQVYSEKETLEIKDVHFGDVYLLNGQSNMSYPLNAEEGWEKISKSFLKCNAYCLNLPEADTLHEAYDVHRPFLPQEDISSRFHWIKLDEKNCLEISGLSMMLASILSSKVNYPIGVIHTAMGGLSIESYLSKEYVDKDKELIKLLKWRGAYYNSESEYNHFIGRNFTQLNGVFNEKINPLKKLSIKGVCWYLGESSCYDFNVAHYYEVALKNMINSYRKIFNDPHLPFLLTNIADDFYPFGEYFGFNYINEIINECPLNDVYPIPIHDIESRWVNENDKEIYYHPIHPRNKLEIANRYADSFLHLNKNKTFYFPHISSYEIKGENIIIHVKSLFNIKPKKFYKGFTIAGEDNVYYPASEVKLLDGKTLLISSKYVKNPTNFTYLFNNYPYLDVIKTNNGMPLLQYRSKKESVLEGTYIQNASILSCQHIKVRESNFGFEVSGGFYNDIFSKSTIFKGKTSIKKVRINDVVNPYAISLKSYRSKKDNYYYFAINIKVGLSGARHSFDKFKYLLLTIKGEENIEFHGALFRDNGMILKLPTLNEKGDIIPFINLDSSFKTYAITLTNYQDGSEGIYNKDLNLFKHISSIELYFRSYEKEATILFNNLVQSMSLDNVSALSKKEKEEAKDNTMVIPKNY